MGRRRAPHPLVAPSGSRSTRAGAHASGATCASRAIPTCSSSVTSPRRARPARPALSAARAGRDATGPSRRPQIDPTPAAAAARRSATSTRARWRRSGATARSPNCHSACASAASSPGSMWLGLHLLYLIGFRNRVTVLAQLGLELPHVRPRRPPDRRARTSPPTIRSPDRWWGARRSGAAVRSAPRTRRSCRRPVPPHPTCPTSRRPG